MSDFQQAIKWMKEGKKVRRKIFEEEFYLYLDRQDRIQESHESTSNTHSNDYIPNLEATDWEIFEGKVKLKTLKDLPENKIIVETNVSRIEREVDVTDNNGMPVSGFVHKDIVKQGAIELIKEKYNPDKTTMELKDLFDFFNITEEDLQ